MSVLGVAGLNGGNGLKDFSLLEKIALIYLPKEFGFRRETDEAKRPEEDLRQDLGQDFQSVLFQLGSVSGSEIKTQSVLIPTLSPAKYHRSVALIRY